MGVEGGGGAQKQCLSDSCYTILFQHCANVQARQWTVLSSVMSSGVALQYTLSLSVKGHMAVPGCCLKEPLSCSGLQTSMVAQQLGVDTIILQATLLLPEQVVVPVIICEAPAHNTEHKACAEYCRKDWLQEQ